MATYHDGPVIKSEVKEKHSSHSFKWSFSETKNRFEVHCNKAGTVLDSLKTSQLFTKKLGKHKKEEIVIVSNGKAISSHIPCTCIEHDLFIKFIKAVGVDENTPQQSAPLFRKGPCQEFVTFNVEVKGKTGIVKIMRNPELKKKIQEVTLYGYKGEKIKYALKRDGRFLDTVFKKTCGLMDISNETTTEMSNIVDNLQGKTFRIIQLDKCSPPDSQPSSLDEALCSVQVESMENQGSENPSQQHSTIKTENDSAVETHSNPIAQASTLFEKPVRVLHEQLTAQFRGAIGSRKTEARKFSHIQNLFRVEYSKNAELCRDVKMMKKLMALSDSVCQVRIDNRPIGSGFLLFEKFVLTNAHVIKEVYNEDGGQLLNSITVHFSFESLGVVAPGHKVEEVVGYEYLPDVQGFDWALLKLEAGQEVPNYLLSSFGFLPQGGGISIIGHPDGHVKKIDPCVVVQTENQMSVVKKQAQKNQENIQLITSRFFEKVYDDLQQRSQVMTYKTSFYHGSSGSPVFDGHCNVVAMHSGGYPYGTLQKKVQSVVEYGYPLSTVLEKIIIQMVEKRKFDVLEKYLNSECKHHKAIQKNVKKLVDSRNLTMFKWVIGQEIDPSAPHVKVMLNFINQKDEPVPMES